MDKSLAIALAGLLAASPCILAQAPSVAQPPSPLSMPRDVVFVDQPHEGGAIWLRGDTYKASLAGDAFTYIPFLGADAPRNFPLELKLLSVRAGEQALDLSGAKLVSEPGHLPRSKAQVEVRRQQVVEIYDVMPGHVRQSFRLDQLPDARGAVEVVLQVQSELQGRADGGDLVFTGPRGDVRYSDFVAVDARGARLPLPIRYTDGCIRLQVPASFVAEAVLPLTVDPVLSGGQVTTTTDVRMEPDVAWNQQAQEHLIVYRVPFSAVDWDVAAWQTGFWMNPITWFWIDYTGDHWVQPKVATVHHAGMFLVVGQVMVGTSGPEFIHARRFEAMGAVRTLHPLITGFSPGYTGACLTPDVGGDPYPSAQAYFTVVWRYMNGPNDGDIHYRQLTTAGVFRTAAPLILNNGVYNDAEPAISKSCGPGTHAVVWSQTSTGFTADIVMAELGYSGGIWVPAMYLDTSNNWDTRPRVSTPAQLPGQQVFLVTWQRNYDPFTNPPYGRLHGAVITSNPSAVLINRYDLSALIGVPAGLLAHEPAVDSDGVRFALAHTEWTAAPNVRTNTFISTLALDGTNLLVHEARAALQTTGPHGFSSAIASRYGASLATTRTHSVVCGTNVIGVNGYVYNAHMPGQTISTRPAGCGNLQMTVTGYPMLGESLTITVNSSDPYRGIAFGTPAPLAPVFPHCQTCPWGVGNFTLVASPLSGPIPYLPALVGYTLSVQGYSIGTASTCGNFRLSDVVDLTLR